MTALLRPLDLAALAEGRPSAPDVWRHALSCRVAGRVGVPLEGILASIGFCEEDAAALVDIKESARADVDAIARGMRERMLGEEISPGAFDQAIVVWLAHLLEGNHDVAYFEARCSLAAGRVLAGLPTERLLAGLHLLRADLMRRSCARSEGGEPMRAVEAVAKLLDVELTVMLAVKEAREALPDLTQLLFENLPVRAFLLDREGRVVAHTPLAGPSCRTDRDRVVGAPLSDVLSEALWEAAELDRWLALARESGGEVVVPRAEVAYADGLRSYRVSVLPLGAGDVEALVHVEDVTEAIADEGRARHAWHVAQLGIMASAVAHEIRNPLMAISAALQVIQGTLPLDDQHRGALEKVSEQVLSLGRVVADLVVFSRPIRAERFEVDLVAVATETCHELGVKDLVEVTGGGRALGDASLIARALMSLVDNARQSGATRVVIDVASGRIEVHDDGPGIPKSDRERIFEPFFTTRTRGAGLGLPIARRSVEAMGGRLSLCESRLRGAAFRLSLAS